MNDKKLILGTFTNQNDAQDAIKDLENQGYNPKEDISFVSTDKSTNESMAESTGAKVAGGAASGAGIGAAIGGGLGLLIGIGSIVVPGGFLIGGPLVAALGLGGAAATTASGALTGAFAGGLIGALVGLGVPEDQAKVYDESVKSGNILVTVPVRNDNDQQVMNTFKMHNAQNISLTSK